MTDRDHSPVTKPMPKEKRAEVYVTLTQEEREAIAAGIGALEALYANAAPISRPIYEAYAPTLRSLLERLGGING